MVRCGARWAGKGGAQVGERDGPNATKQKTTAMVSL